LALAALALLSTRWRGLWALARRRRRSPGAAAQHATV